MIERIHRQYLKLLTGKGISYRPDPKGIESLKQFQDETPVFSN